MQRLQRDTLNTFAVLLKLYTSERDIKTFINYLDKDVAWLGIGKSEFYCGLEETKNYLFSQDDSHYKRLRVVKNDTTSKVITENICSLYGNIFITIDNTDTPMQVIIRLTSVFERNKDGELKLKRVHFSLPYADYENNTFLPPVQHDNSLFVLKTLLDNQNAILDEQNNDMKTLTENLPGGIYKCKFDKNLTLVQYSDGFLNLLGYQKIELKELFNNSFKQLIYPLDIDRTIEEVNCQLKKSNSKSIEYRITKKNGETIWVLDKGQYVPPEPGEKYGSFCCIIIDITNEKKARQELKQSLERLNIIMEQSLEIIFEWDISADQLKISPKWQNKFGYEPIKQNISQTLLKNGHIFADDLELFRGLVSRVKQTKEFPTFDFRIINSANEIIWCRINATVLCNECGAAERVIGVIEDIDEQKKATQLLTEQAEKDALTGLYNKMTAQSLAENYIKRSAALNALLVIDIDDFKNVNDTKGHLFGDAVLSDIASELKKIAPKESFIGRIGGDEFSLLLKNIPDFNYAENIAQKILSIFNSLFKPTAETFNISCSIGIAITPFAGKDYNTLFGNADIALYKAKCMGKNQYVLYDEKLSENNFFSISEYAAAKSNKEFEKITQKFENNLSAYVFRALYKSKNIESAIQLILEIIGRQFDVSRAYIFENSQDKEFFSNTFEWCNDSIPSEKNFLQNMKLDKYDNYYGNFDENGIFYCRDIKQLPLSQRQVLESQNIKSLLQCAIYDNGEIVGMVGFDECNLKRYWTQEQIDALILVSEIVSTFLLKQRTQERLQEALERTTKMLDCQNSFVYAVEAKTFNLLYFNEKTRQIAKNTQLGHTCHKEFFNDDFQCENCPIRQLETNGDGQMDVFNPILKVWTSTEATKINWSGKEAYLLTCYDLTKYKK